MKTRTRYLFIIFGLFIFAVLGPLIVFFVSGTSYDFKNNRYVKTGILSTETDPDPFASIFLDDKLSGQTPANIRFLNPREYVVTLKKEWLFRLEKKS